MLPKFRKFSIKNSYRLKKEKNLHKSYKYYNLKIINLKEKKPTQFAVVVSKKVNKSAVKRNRIKRQFYTAINSNLDKVKDGFVVLIYVKQNINSASFVKIKQQFLNNLLDFNITNT